MIDLNSEVTVSLNADHTATEALSNLASRADYMIVDTANAKHSATAAIDAVLPRAEQIFPIGSGIASFLEALRTRLDDGSTAQR